MKFNVPNTNRPVEIFDDKNITIGNGRFSNPWIAFFTGLKQGVVGRSQFGPTAERPTSILEVGLPFFDTTLGKPIWIVQVNPTVIWIDSTGAIV